MGPRYRVMWHRLAPHSKGRVHVPQLERFPGGPIELESIMRGTCFGLRRTKSDSQAFQGAAYRHQPMLPT